MKQFIVAIVLASICFMNIEAASYCYSCSNCNDPFDSQTNMSCPAGSDTCMKTYISYPSSLTSLASTSASKLIYRGCVPAASCPTSFGFSIISYGFSIACCNDNLCNSAQTNQLKLFTLAFPLMAALFYLRK